VLGKPGPRRRSTSASGSSVSIGINLPVFPSWWFVPNYPVLLCPRGNVNLFFYESLYWAYQGDEWVLESSWYNGPWGLVGPEYVPAFVLRVPVRYYRQPPVAWVGWRSEASPALGRALRGHDWEQRRSGWDRLDRGARLAPAPLPVYQRTVHGGTVIRAWSSSACWSARSIAISRQDSVVRQYRQQRDAAAAATGRSGARAGADRSGTGRPGHSAREASSPPRRRSRASSPGPRHRRVRLRDQPAPAAPVVQREQPKPPRPSGRSHSGGKRRTRRSRTRTRVRTRTGAGTGEGPGTK
jgi:hypothetical protein